ncbi:hypothetical protein Tco_0044784 [Tanacetum coccineum]
MLISKSITDEMGSTLIVACRRISSTVRRSGLTSTSVPSGRWDPSYDASLGCLLNVSSGYASGCDSDSSTAADVD